MSRNAFGTLGNRSLTLALAAIVLLLGASGASAQYFGQNKVQYKDLKFQVLKTDHFDIYFYPSERDGIDIAARLAERWRVRLGRILNHDLSGRQVLVLYGSHTDFEQTNILEGQLGEGTGGVTESVLRRIILPLGGPIADTDHVIGHELVHAYQFDISSRPGTPQNGANMLPLWFIEGMAEYLSLGPVDANTAMWLRDAVRNEDRGSKLPDLKDLNNPKYFPYRWGQAFWAYVGGRWGDGVIGDMLDIAGATGDIDLAITRTLGVTSKELSDDWHTAIRRAYSVTASEDEQLGTVVIQGRGLGTDMNIGPSISPDGRMIAFLSERSLLSIDLYVADAANGKVLRKLTSTSTDPHFSSIQFIASAGAWDAESKRIAIAAISSGKPALAIYNALNGDKEDEFKVGDLDEILNPTWAPDGHSIAFSGMARGLTDLFVYDLTTKQLRQLTHDAFADIQPAWAPNGRSIAFATDRFSSNLDRLEMGAYRIALIDPQSGAIRPITAFTDGKNINPQWAPDSSSILFISDRDGIANLYQVSLGTGAVAQLTSTRTGLSGITATSPALSVASRAGVAAFSVYNNGGYDIHTLPLTNSNGDLTIPSIARIDLSPVSDTAAMLPPLDRRPSDVSGYLADATSGLPDTTPDNVEDYKAKLSLQTIGQPQIAVGASRYGAAIGGGISMSFGDLLGNHILDTTVQFNSAINGNFSIKDTIASVAYLNRTHRWNWGVAASQVPYTSGSVQQGVDIVNGAPAFVDRTIVFRQTELGANGILMYPLNRAQRIEFQSGFSRVSFDEITRTQAFTLDTGQQFLDDTNTTPFGETLTLATNAAALVYDTSSFGATSPISGQSYRFEAAPTFGTVNYMGVLTDYRRYWMPAPFYTLAGRVLHYGRYGSGGDDSRLVPLYLGYANLVRGYDVNTFDAADCTPNAVSDCPEFDRLLGSRMLVGNLEFRFPLLRPFGVSQAMYGPVPTEVALFADSGVAWDSSSKPEIFGGSRSAVTSLGAAVRVNFLGFAVGQFSWARPLQRNAHGWIFQFIFSPGF
ncbi:MAG TPA: hypothetical protein VJP86_06230 [Vicinamibacterales bacterium]|jgi:Tol biopolymer transport system component|nr:hypothetical protein [Vicinamibacterales bacterium]